MRGGGGADREQWLESQVGGNDESVVHNKRLGDSMRSKWPR